ncbi:MAG: amino acid ABC transporter permease [Acidimicrobiales bacterium]
MSVVLDNLDRFLEGMRTTVSLTLVSFAFALAIGTVVAGMRVSPIPPLRAAGTTYVTAVRNSPLAVLMTLFFFGFPDIGVKFDSVFVSAVIVLAAYTGTFVAETVRSGINAVAQGQGEAARALGLTFPQTMRIVVLPQALRTVVAPLGSIFIALIKNSSLAGLIGASDLVEVGERLNTEEAQPIAIYLGVAIGYLLLTIPTGFVVSWVERRVAIKR